ncbi:hypothetical protein JYU34_001771, partial [Plutella xylostella]
DRGVTDCPHLLATLHACAFARRRDAVDAATGGSLLPLGCSRMPLVLPVAMTTALPGPSALSHSPKRIQISK